LKGKRMHRVWDQFSREEAQKRPWTPAFWPVKGHRLSTVCPNTSPDELPNVIGIEGVRTKVGTNRTLLIVYVNRKIPKPLRKKEILPRVDSSN
jgi:hypothetical protein